MIFMLFGVLIGVFVEQTYSLPNIKDSISTCASRRKNYGEDNIQEAGTKHNEHEDDHFERTRGTEGTEETEGTEGNEGNEETENHID
jgi:hypothetical protein